MKVYDFVKRLLEKDVKCRNSDKELIWKVWEATAKVRYINGKLVLSKEDFLSALTPETITRARRKIVERYPHLKGSEVTELARGLKEKEKGTFIYRDKLF